MTRIKADIIIQVAAVIEISLIKVKEGDSHMLKVATDVAEKGVAKIPRVSDASWARFSIMIVPGLRDFQASADDDCVQR